MSGSPDEPKPWPLLGYAPGDYSCRCSRCEKEFTGDKRAVQCLECAVTITHQALQVTVAMAQKHAKSVACDARQIDALKGAGAWLDRWAAHVGSCLGGRFCTCGLTAIRAEVEIALVGPDHDG